MYLALRARSILPAPARFAQACESSGSRLRFHACSRGESNTDDDPRMLMGRRQRGIRHYDGFSRRSHRIPILRATGGNSQRAITTGLVVYGIILLFMIEGSILFLLVAFNIRSSMVRYYNTVEPIHLRMSGVMTFFFHVLYIQYRMSRIAKWKETGFLIPRQ